MPELTDQETFIIFMNTHRKDAWGQVITHFLDILKRSEQSVQSLLFDANMKELPPNNGPFKRFQPTGTYTLKLTFKDGTIASTHIHHSTVHDLTFNEYNLELPAKDINHAR